MVVTSVHLFQCIRSNNVSSSYVSSMLFHGFTFSLWTWSRPRRQARLKTTGGAGTCKCKADMLVALVNATYVKHFSTMLLAFNALPVPLLSQVFIFGHLGLFFSC